MSKRFVKVSLALLALALSFLLGSWQAYSQAPPDAKPKIVSAFFSQNLGDVAVDESGNVFILRYVTDTDSVAYWFKSGNIIEQATFRSAWLEANRPKK